jgi:ABC-type transporter Mla maintaining outer membrane lipid asymmetry permease subunit MlaE
VSGRPAGARHTSPWLRSMRDERELDARQKFGISPIERVLVISVVAAVLVFEVWFFFFAGSALPNG